MTDSLKLPTASLKLQFNQAEYSFLSDTLGAPLSNILGQERAQSALDFGIAMQNPGYNIYQ